MKKSYRLKLRKALKGSIWYYKLPNEITFHSTGTGNRRAAEKYVVEEVLGKKKPTLGPTLKSYAVPTLMEYAESRRLLNRPLVELYIERRARLIEKYILTDSIADMRLGLIRLADSERFRDRVLEELSDSQPTAKLVISAYKWIVSRATKRGVIDRDPAAGMDNPKINQRQRSIYTLEELTALFRGDVWETGNFAPWKGAEDYTVFLLALCTGARRGELLGLLWSAVKLLEDRGYIEVKVQLNDKGQLAPPKSKHARKTPIFDFVFWPKECRAVKALGKLASRRKNVSTDTPVFGYADGSYRGGTWWNTHLSAGLKTAGISRDRGPDKLPLDGHAFRHTLASHLKAARLPSDSIRQFCGWGGEQVMASYTHVDDPDLFEKIRSLIETTREDEGAVGS
jgi:integrase